MKKRLEEDIEKYKNRQLYKRQFISYILLIGYPLIIWGINLINYDINNSFENIKKWWFLHSLIFGGFVTYWFFININHSNIKSFKENIKLPDKLK